MYRDLNTIVKKVSDLGLISDDTVRLIINEDACNEMTGELRIEGLKSLEGIIIKSNSMQNLESLIVCNCEKLESIVLEEDACRNTKTVKLFSLIDLIVLIRASSISNYYYW